MTPFPPPSAGTKVSWPGRKDADPRACLGHTPSPPIEPASAESIEHLLDWESWKGGHEFPFWQHAVAGSCAGIVEHTIIFPLDTMKTRLQAARLSSSGRGALRGIIRDVRREAGFRGFFRGLCAISAGCAPAHAVMFSVFEASKSRVSTDHPATAAACGGVATFCHDLILTPTDVIKQRMQLGCFKSGLHCARVTYRSEGLRSFYRSLPTTLAMNLPFGAVLVTANETLKRWIGFERAAATKSSESHVPARLLANYFLCAGISGAVAGAITTPLDVIKTRLQTQDLALYSLNQTGARPIESCSVGGKQVSPSSVNYSCASVTSELGSCAAASSESLPARAVPPNSTTPPGRNLSPFWRMMSCSHVCLRPKVTSAAVTASAPPSRSSLRHTSSSSSLRADLPRQIKYVNFLSTVKLICQEEGFSGLWRGVSTRLALSIPSAAVCWGTYESVRYVLMGLRRSEFRDVS